MKSGIPKYQERVHFYDVFTTSVACHASLNILLIPQYWDAQFYSVVSSIALLNNATRFFAVFGSNKTCFRNVDYKKDSTT